MNCNARQEQLSLLLDGESAAFGQADLFVHLGACADCRDWFDTITTVRGAARRDREAIAGAADDLPSLPVPSDSRRGVARRSARSGRVWRLPVPLAAALCFVLLAAGALVGTRWPLLAGRPIAAQASGERVVVICSLPEVTVLPQGEAR